MGIYMPVRGQRKGGDGGTRACPRGAPGGVRARHERVLGGDVESYVEEHVAVGLG